MGLWWEEERNVRCERGDGGHGDYGRGERVWVRNGGGVGGRRGGEGRL